MALVLVVDDDAAVRLVVAELLRRAGYEVDEAADGRECLDRLDAGYRPDLVLLDLLMPRMDGAAVLAALDPRNGWPPVIVMSGHFDRERFADIRGAAGRIAKPFDGDQLLAVVEAALRERAQ